MNRTPRHAPAPSRAPRRVGLVPVVGALLVALGTVSTPTSVRAATGEILAEDIAPFEVVYDVGNNLITAGIANLSLQRNGDGWVYSLATKPTGVFKLTGKGRIRETSVMDIVPTGDDTVELRPTSYSYRQDDETRRSVDATFDWDARTLTWQRRGEEGTESFPEPVLDRLSVTLAVMNLLRGGFEEIELEVFDNGRMKTMRFVNQGREMLETEMGEIETIRVRGENAAGSSRSSLTWFAPSLDYVPVRIEQRKRDELVARMNLMKLENRITDLELADPDALDAPAEALPLELPADAK